MESGIDEANEERLEISENIFIGIAHSPQNDMNYKCLLEFWSIINITNEAVLKILTNRYGKDDSNKISQRSRQNNSNLMLKDIPQAIIQIIIERSIQGWSIKTISSCFSTSPLIVRKIIKWSKTEQRGMDGLHKSK